MGQQIKVKNTCDKCGFEEEVADVAPNGTARPINELLKGGWFLGEYRMSEEVMVTDRRYHKLLCGKCHNEVVELVRTAFAKGDSADGRNFPNRGGQGYQ